MRGVTAGGRTARRHVLFLLTRLMRGVTQGKCVLGRIFSISTHTPHARRDIVRSVLISDRHKFLLTRLMRGVTWSDNAFSRGGEISTHTPHARRDAFTLRRDFGVIISTHTPHARRDGVGAIYTTTDGHFYSHASCEA